MRSIKRQSEKKGQVFAEFAIIMPVYILFIMGFIQLVMIMHAKFMVDYGVFCAARAGIISKADKTHMKEALAVALSPLFQRTDSIISVTTGMAEALIKIGDSEADFVHPIRLYLTNEDASDLRDKYEATSSTSDLSQDEKVLKVKVDYDYPLDIPVANKIIAAIMSGFINSGTPLEGEWLYPNSITSSPTILISSQCAMRLSTMKEFS